MKNKVLRSLTYCLLVFSTSALLRADRAADRRREVIPTGHQMHTPRHKFIQSLATPGPTGYVPQQLRHAYGFSQLGTTGAGQTIAIVDAYGSPTIQADLDTFCATFFYIPSTTVAVYYPQGQPGADSGWAGETSLDVEWAHAIAPEAKIVLVVAKSASTTDLFAAVDYAVSLGATQVSMSWGGSEFSTESTSDYHFNVSGVTFFASSGDSGAGASYPASSPFVVSVGGTSLHLDSSANSSSETAWSGSGGGMSAYEPVPSYQSGWWSGANRGIPDVAYDADPATGVPVYQTGVGWGQYGGTSMSAPQWAALFALANSLRTQPISSAPNLLYSLANSNYAGYFRDITSGSNGNPAGTGYDLVTGLGVPLGNQLVLALAGGFSSQTAAPVFFPAAGVYSSAQNVTLVSATPGASIRYTLDGSTPTSTSGIIYSGPVNLSAVTTLKAIAYTSGLTDSATTSSAYTFIPQAAAPGFSPAADTYASAQTVTITATTSGASIRYTTDGSTPTETNGTLYTGPVMISRTAVLKAIAYASGFGDSPVTGGDYTIPSSPAAILNVVSDFTTSGNGGSKPTASLLQGSDGDFYGTTTGGGSGNNGTAFKLTPTGTLSTLASFNGTNGTAPYAGLVQGSDGNFYGTTVTGGSTNNGTTFQLTPAGALTTLVSFSSTGGYSLYAGLTQGSDGNFYGTTVLGGNANSGTIFRMTPAGTLSTLVLLSSATNGGNPYAGLIQGSDGNFYGTTFIGGSGGSGTVFKMTPAGVLTTLVSFTGANGAQPAAALVQGSDGNFYGTTQFGGTSSDGTVFKVTPAGVLTTLVSFTGANGAQPAAAPVQGSDGNFYGTTQFGGTSSDGTVFKVTPAGVLTTLVSFTGANGAQPAAALVQGSDGNLYGTTINGGSSNDGVIFQLVIPSAPQTAAPVFSPPPGPYADVQSVTISSATSGASIRYTTDGSTPTETNGTIYSGPVSVDGIVALHAIAYASGFTDSQVTGGLYSILHGNAPVFSPAPGTYTSTQTVTITSNISSVAIRYTTDGSTPTETHGTIYSGPVTIRTTTTLQAIAYIGGFLDSAVASGTYTISHPVPSWALRDFNGDGQPDILWRNATTGDVAVWTMNGTTVTGATFIANIGPPWSIVGVGDFNQDGNADILWRNGTTGEIGVTLMSGTTITSYVGLGALDPSWTVAGLGDFNNDGQTDVFLDNTTTGEVGFWALNGTTVTGYTSIGTLPSPWTIASVGDFNGDGKSDLLWYNPTTGDLIVSLMDGAAATAFQPVGNLPLPWTVAGLADFNGDGSVDILLRNATTGDTGLFLMNGTTPTSFVPLGNVPAPWQPSD